MTELDKKVINYCKRFIEAQGQNIPLFNESVNVRVQMIRNVNEENIMALEPTLIYDPQKKGFTKVIYNCPNNDLELKGLIAPYGLSEKEYTKREVVLNEVLEVEKK